jgi:hypothetical protein
MVYGLWLIGGNCEKLLEGVNKEGTPCLLSSYSGPASPQPESIERFKEYCRLSRRRMIHGSSPIPLPLSRQQFVSLSQSSCVSPVELRDGRWGGGRGGGEEEPKHYDCEKALSYINHSIYFQASAVSGQCQWALTLA